MEEKRIFDDYYYDWVAIYLEIENISWCRCQPVGGIFGLFCFSHREMEWEELMEGLNGNTSYGIKNTFEIVSMLSKWSHFGEMSRFMYGAVFGLHFFIAQTLNTSDTSEKKSNQMYNNIGCSELEWIGDKVLMTFQSKQKPA